jgi:hypothetical protein
LQTTYRRRDSLHLDHMAPAGTAQRTSCLRLVNGREEGCVGMGEEVMNNQLGLGREAAAAHWTCGKQALARGAKEARRLESVIGRSTTKCAQEEQL